MNKKLFVTVITGFVNTGKTHVLSDLLSNRNPAEESAVIMNDIAEVVNGTSKVRKAMGEENPLLLELPNGCICCTLKDVFLEAIEKVANSSVDHLYIEGNATAEPYLIRGFLEKSSVAEQMHIQNVITVIDAKTFLQDFLSTDHLRDRGLVALSHDDRLVSEVLAEQIECADTLVITKGCSVSESDLVLLEATLAALNPKASITILGRNKSSTNSQKIQKFVFRSNKPFHPSRLHSALQGSAFASLLRIRGTAWLATRQEYKISWSQTGSMCSLESDGPWWSKGGSAQEEEFNAKWFEYCGNRYQDIECIGAGLDSHQLKEVLETCLLTELEMQLGPDLWKHFDDPFDQWVDLMDRSLFIVRQEHTKIL